MKKIKESSGRYKSIEFIKKIGFKDNEKYNFSQKYYRLSGVYVTFILQFLPITPNMVTFAAIFVSFLAGVFFISTSPLIQLGSVLFLLLGEVLDYADGNLARVINRTSRLASYFLDHFYHEIPSQFIFLFIGVGAYFHLNDVGLLMLGIITLIFQSMTMHISQLRVSTIAVKSRGTNFVNENVNNPFLKNKKEKILLELFVFPLKYNKWIFLTLILLGFLIPNLIYYSLYFYGPFIVLRYFGYFLQSFLGLKNIEKNENKIENKKNQENK